MQDCNPNCFRTLLPAGVARVEENVSAEGKLVNAKLRCKREIVAVGFLFQEIKN